MFTGAITDLVTPFTDGECDLEAFSDLVEWQVSAGAHGLRMGSEVGESSSLTMPEVEKLVQLCLDIADGRTPVFYRLPPYLPLPEMIEHGQRVLRLGVACLTLPLPIRHPTQTTGAIDYAHTVHDAVDAPLIPELPSLSGKDIPFSATDIAALTSLPHIAGLMITNASALSIRCLHASLAHPLALFTTDDSETPALLAAGGHGTFSATMNAAPAPLVALHNSWTDRSLDPFSHARDAVAPLLAALARTHPAPAVKYALQRLGLCSDEVRLPLNTASREIRDEIDKTLARIGDFNASSARNAA